MFENEKSSDIYLGIYDKMLQLVGDAVQSARPVNVKHSAAKSQPLTKSP
jgi:hypothetical protein